MYIIGYINGKLVNKFVLLYRGLAGLTVYFINQVIFQINKINIR